MKFTYLDWAATAPPNQDALAYGNSIAREYYANPSALHDEGKRAAAKLEEIRTEIAALLGCRPRQLLFTSGGSESNSIVFSQLLLKPRRGGVLTSRIEHASVWETAQLYRSWGHDLAVAEADSTGKVAPEALSSKLTPDTDLVSIMLVNNETGRIQDLPALVEAVRGAKTVKRRVHFHTDAVQALGKIPLNLEELGIDSASFSGHKLGAPRGIGLLYCKQPLDSAFRGGGQEFGIRPGTENLAGAAALAYCLREQLPSLEEERGKIRRLSRLLTEGVMKISGAAILPAAYSPESPDFIPHILKCSFPPLPGEVIQRVLNDQGIAVSTGSACASHKRRTNRVLKAMGVSAKLAESSIRVSIGSGTSEQDINDFLTAAENAVA